MTRVPPASSSLRLLALLLGLALPAAFARAQEEKDETGAASLTVPAGAAPQLDGKLAAGEWEEAARFTARHGDTSVGEGRMRRSGRQLYIGMRSNLDALGLGLRFNFRNPKTQARAQVMVVPLNPPRPPLVAYREPVDGTPQRISAASCDVSFDFSPDSGFTLEMRVPLDLIGLGHASGTYGFNVEFWNLESEEPLGAYPLADDFVTAGEATLAPAGDWGAVDEAKPPVNTAIRLLERIEVEGLGSADGAIPCEDTMLAYMGWRDGKRRDAPLARLQERLGKEIAAHPDYASLGATLIWVHLGRSDLEAAHAAHLELAERYPLLGQSGRHLIVLAQLLRGMGRYGEALELLGRLPGYSRQPMGRQELATLRALREAQRFEEAQRTEEGKRGDLPRVRIHVTAPDGKPRGTLLLELYEDDAPNAVANFVSLVERGFYAGTRFHWVEGGRRVIGGDPNSKDDDPRNDGFGGPGYRIEPEPSRRLNLRYTVAFSDERGKRRSEGSAFMIHIEAFPAIDGVTSVFGRVVQGFDTLRAIEYYDVIAKTEVVRKRDHDYTPVTR